MKAIKPKKIPPGKRETNAALRAAMEDGGETVVELTGRTIRTWNSPPKVRAEVKGRGGDYVLNVKFTPEERGQIWDWLNAGTSVRFAIMSEDFIPKTAPKLISSKAGRGGVLVIDPAHPQPGIEARGWSGMIAERAGRDLTKAMKRRLKEIS